MMLLTSRRGMVSPLDRNGAKTMAPRGVPPVTAFVVSPEGYTRAGCGDRCASGGFVRPHGKRRDELVEVVGRVLPALDRVTRNTHREHGIVVAVRVEAVADEEHVVEGDAGLLGELAHAVGLV